jgi:N6-adenosine-specific RNA methylase IME4
MWTTDAHLPQALELGAAWGFAYSTVAFVWAKRTHTGRVWKFGGGHATRKGAELCLLFLRGWLARKSASVRQLVVAPVDPRHSTKPAEVRDRIMNLADGPYLEMFARERGAGWDAWGDQVERDGRAAYDQGDMINLTAGIACRGGRSC